MKSSFLILFIIFNMLTINLVSASKMYDEKTSESHLIQIQGESDLGSCIDESACDHFCHFSSHMMGLISQITQPLTTEVAVTYFALNEAFHSLIIPPPFQPPKA